MTAFGEWRMKSNLIPDWTVPSYASVTPDWLRERGMQGVVADIDNTLAGYGEPEPDERVLEWVRLLKASDIRLSVASNNKERRVRAFCRLLDVPFVAKAGKPGPAGVLRAVSFLGLPPDRVCFVGDQIFTDTLAANRAGLLSILVNPIALDKPLYKLRYMIEKQFIRKAKNKL